VSLAVFGLTAPRCDQVYIYVPQYESGGKLFYMVFNRTIVALLLSHTTLIGYMLTLGTLLVAPSRSR
jgi:hypothetical protein